METLDHLILSLGSNGSDEEELVPYAYDHDGIWIDWDMYYTLTTMMVPWYDAADAYYTMADQNDADADGTVVACGSNDGRCDIPAQGDVKYTQVAAGGYHTCKRNEDGTIASTSPAPGDAKYTQVAAGGYGTGLLNEDGAVVSSDGQCDAFHSYWSATNIQLSIILTLLL